MQGNWTGFENRRRRMIERLARMGIGTRVLQAMDRVPRHLFVEEALQTRAYDEMSLPLGLGQTISQPYTVAKMTELLLGGSSQNMRRVLEIGTGCGYQTAVLLALDLPEIYSVERLRPLHERAKQHLRAAGLLAKARTVCGDGYLGLPEVAPFDGILVTAAPAEIPLALLQQLAVGGRMVLPLDEGGVQYLWLIEKTPQGYRETCVQEANFVPLVSGMDT
ncbi:protein-L-isoaspartate O-methyltransferase [Neisseria animaloris]|uniref:Protein-L-isoaspartate O-methyltransferase n=1 Tax=Neisseria dumasiana TaxID=1931275 RepID=A0A1X3DLH8_9NEIS|nr:MULTISPECIES: protein-L-isoaspartate(D-aspartate) O-methyltransferase [Neisseria]KPN72949.1 protein-L-isoaspartate O-methyltransferase [Neisseria sp. 74A18]OSI08982.1 protein-L-isoaspartate O-methyltransferase [Neisseria animaloris]OSI25428.1 protein-L-isoaspartate O-methyltransferase [Neisseria dumasiana]VEH87025.1 protein-L-isoaspartate O-methyltransferase [Neisseria animaloris]